MRAREGLNAPGGRHPAQGMRDSVTVGSACQNGNRDHQEHPQTNHQKKYGIGSHGRSPTVAASDFKIGRRVAFGYTGIPYFDVI